MTKQFWTICLTKKNLFVPLMLHSAILKDVFLSSSDFIKMANGAMITSGNLPELPADSYLRLTHPDGKLFAIGKSTGSG